MKIVHPEIYFRWRDYVEAHPELTVEQRYEKLDELIKEFYGGRKPVNL